MELIPQSKLKDVLITRTAIKTLTSEHVVEKIVSFQFKDVRDAAKEHHSIEISGFGVFLLSQNKLKKKIVILQRIISRIEEKIKKTEDTNIIETLNKKLESTQKNLDNLERKLK